MAGCIRAEASVVLFTGWLGHDLRTTRLLSGVEIRRESLHKCSCLRLRNVGETLPSNASYPEYIAEKVVRELALSILRRFH